jgi:hypothetical protein
MAAKPTVEEDDEPQSAGASMVSPNGPPEGAESPEDEAKESPDEQDQEAKDGTEQDTSSVAVPEQFQRVAASVIQSATTPQLEFLRSLIMDREKTLRKAESKAGKAGTFDTEGM